MDKAIVSQLPILNGIANSNEHQQALILLDDLLEHYDENLIIIEALSMLLYGTRMGQHSLMLSINDR